MTTDARSLILFGYDWDASAFARLKHDWPADHAGFDLFTFPSYLRLATFDLQRFVDDLAVRAQRRGWRAVVQSASTERLEAEDSHSGLIHHWMSQLVSYSTPPAQAWQ